MATIHTGTTLAPSKLELLADWLPQRPWYLDAGAPPALTKAGGFRLDDPAGDVGIEFMLVTDAAGERETTYSVPMTYRAAPLEGADDALIGTSEHGVLGTRWFYDAAHDPVAVDQLLALITGSAQAQHQSRSETLDPSVRRAWVSVDSRLVAPSPLRVSDRRPGRTAVDVRLTDDSPREDGDLTLDLVRVLPGDGYTGLGHVEVPWTRLDGESARGLVAVVW
jgi:Maltokinase N-terminal cap domain